MAAKAAKNATAESSPPRLREATKPDLLTIAAITIAATVIADLIHEGLGHGGMCVATGGRPLVLRAFLGRDAKIRVRRARQLTVTPYFTAWVLACLAGALNPVGPLLILISAAAASFWWQLRAGMDVEPAPRPAIPGGEFQMPEIERSRGWIIAAVVLAIGFIAGFGPGVKFHSL
jgi:hypothetical protein